MLAVIDAEAMLEIAQRAVGIGIVADRRAPGLQRLQPPVSDTSELEGGFVREVGTSGPISSAITPGSTWGFQAWYRDAEAGASNFTRAVRVTFR